MANWCDNILILECDNPAQIQRAVKAYNNNRLLWEFLPHPNADGPDSLPYDWMEQNWGSGSDAGKDAGRDPDTSEEAIQASETATWVPLIFLTRSSPPIEAMKAFEAAGFVVTLYYCEYNLGFCGLYSTEGGDLCYDIPDSATEVRETIPVAIDEAFAIAEIQEEIGGFWIEWTMFREETHGAVPTRRPCKIIIQPTEPSGEKPNIETLFTEALLRHGIPINKEC